MDGQSTDGTVDLLKRFQRDNPCLVWSSEADRGQANALNKALELVDTEYFGWLNADDCYLEGGLSKLVEAVMMAQAAAPVIVYGDYQRIDGENRVVKWRRQPSFRLFDCINGYLTVQNSAAIFRTEVVRRLGGFDEALQFAMDYDLVIKVSRQGEVAHVREYVGQFRVHESSKTSTLQDLCARETAAVRRKYSGNGSFAQAVVTPMVKLRVAYRMFWEGCVPCRLGFHPRTLVNPDRPVRQPGYVE
jgi:GT2 family glycosyltransferase